MAVTPDALYLLAEQILNCICVAVDETAADDPEYPGCPCRACVVSATPAHDNCCDCDDGGEVGGQLHVWVSGGPYPYAQGDFPNPQRDVQGFRGCAPPGGTAVELTAELVRCAPTVDERGNPPSCEDMTRTARITATDKMVMYQAIRCCMADIRLPGMARTGRKFLLGEPRMVETQGGCAGSRATVTVDLGSTCPCPEPVVP